MTDVTVTVPASVNIAASVGVDAVSATVATTSISCAVNGSGASNALHYLVTQTETALPNSTVAGSAALLAAGAASGAATLGTDGWLPTTQLPAQFVNVRRYGATGNGTTDDTSAVSAAITAAAATNCRAVYFPAGSYKITSTLQISTRGFHFFGDGHGRPATEGGSRLVFTGTGPLIQIGTDNGHAYDANEYDGVQSFNLSRISLGTSGGVTALSNGNGNYLTGSYAVRDWRGGSVHLDHVTIENFQYGFWGIQSDFDKFVDVGINYCSTGLYIGPRSDQGLFQSVDFLYCDRAIDVDGAKDVHFVDPTVVGCGTASISPVKVHSSSWGYNADRVVFDNGWYELQQGATTTIGTFFEVGASDATTTGSVVIRDSYALGSYTGFSYHVNNFLQVGAATQVTIEHVTGTPQNFDYLVNFITGSPSVSAIVSEGVWAYVTATTTGGTGTLSARSTGVPVRMSRGAPEASANPNNRTVLTLDSQGSNGGTAMTILTPGVAGQISAVFFGAPGDETSGQLAYAYSLKVLSFAVSGSRKAGFTNQGVFVGANSPTSADAGNVVNGLYLQDGTAPNADPTAGAVLYSASGVLGVRSTSGGTGTVEHTGHKDAASGYAGLDSSGLVSVSVLPGFDGGSATSAPRHVQVRRDTRKNFWSNNPTPVAGEVCFETDTGLFVVGNGSAAWRSLRPNVGQFSHGVTAQGGGGNGLVNVNGGSSAAGTASAGLTNGVGHRGTQRYTTSGGAGAVASLAALGQHRVTDGFTYFSRLYFNDASYNNTVASTGSRIFAGLTNNTATNVTNTDTPGAQNIGFFRRHVNGGSTDTNWMLIGASGATYQDTGMAFAVGKVYEFWLVVTAGGSTADWMIANVTDGTQVSGTFSSTMPTAGTYMNVFAGAILSVDAVARSLDVSAVLVRDQTYSL